MSLYDISSILKNFINYAELVFHVKIVDIIQCTSSVLESNKLAVYCHLSELFMDHFTSSLTIIRLNFVTIVNLSIIPVLFFKCKI